MSQLLQTIRQYVRVPAAQSDLAKYDDIQQEIAFHVDERTRQLIDDGMMADEAREVAWERFGDPHKIAQACRLEASGGLALLHQLHLVVTGLLTASVIGLFVVFLIGNRAPSVVIPPGIHSMLDNDWSGNVAGVVVDGNNTPLSTATIVASVKTWPDESFFLRAYTTTTNEKGEFELRNVYPVNEKYELNLAAFAELHGMQSLYVTRNTGGNLEPLRIELSPVTGLLLKVTDEKSMPLSDVEVRPAKRVDASGTEQTIYFDSARFLNLRTDNEGLVSLPWYDLGDAVSLAFRTSEEEWQPLRFQIPNDHSTIDIVFRDGKFLPHNATASDEKIDRPE